MSQLKPVECMNSKKKDRKNSGSEMESKQGETGPVSLSKWELEGAVLAFVFKFLSSMSVLPSE